MNFSRKKRNKISENNRSFAVHGEASIPEHMFLEEVSLLHFLSYTGRKSMPVVKMSFRRFDFFVIYAFLRISYNYATNLLFDRTRPYFTFQVQNIEVGKYITTSIQRARPKTITSKKLFFFHFHFGLLRASFVLGAAMRKKDRVSAVSFGDVWYMDGIWLDYFLPRDGVAVYARLHPFELVCILGNFENLSSLRRSLEQEANSTPVRRQIEVVSYMEKRLADPAGAISYYKTGSLPSSQYDLSDGHYFAVVYCHSFTDAQMNLGYDGFRNVYDWLIFTLQKLLEHGPQLKIVVRAHPVFFAEWGAGTAAIVDREIWESLLLEFDERLNVESSSISNREFLRQFDPSKTVLLSHHGNALPEGAYLGFKIVGSVLATLGRGYDFCNTWGSREEYAQILEDLPKFAGKAGTSTSLNKYISSYYMNESLVQSSSTEIQRVLSRNRVTLEFGRNSPHQFPRSGDLPDEIMKSIKEDYVRSVRLIV